MDLDYEDHGNARVYYKDGRERYCWQQDFDNTFTFYFCSKDGEPQYPVPPLSSYTRSFGDTPTGLLLNNFLDKYGK